MQTTIIEYALPEARLAAHTSDHELVAMVVDGDANAFERLMRRYNQRLFRIARSILRDPDAAQDVVQDAYIRAYYKLPGYRPSGSFGAWLSRITVNEALMAKRKSWNTGNAGDEPLSKLEAPRTGEPAYAAENRQLGDTLEKAIDTLPEAFRTVFVMRAVELLSVADTANSLNIPAATVKTRYHRARRLLRDEIEGLLATNAEHVFEFAGARCDAVCARVLGQTLQRRTDRS